MTLLKAFLIVAVLAVVGHFDREAAEAYAPDPVQREDIEFALRYAVEAKDWDTARKLQAHLNSGAFTAR